MSMEKYQKLVENIKQYSKICICYSGGVDSTLLLKAAKDALGDKAIAVVADIAVMDKDDVEYAVKMAEDIGIACYVTDIDVMEIPQLQFNETNRCYHCKKIIFSGISKVAIFYGIKTVADGKNTDDLKVYRPGAAAAEELKVVSPLCDAGLDKKEIREISRELGLPTWNRPSNPCLATRFPYDTEITLEKIKMVSESEKFIRKFGITNLRLRVHESLARIEVLKDEKHLIVENSDEISDFLEGRGFKYICLDLQGYRSGSMDI